MGGGGQQFKAVLHLLFLCLNTFSSYICRDAYINCIKKKDFSVPGIFEDMKRSVRTSHCVCVSQALDLHVQVLCE